MYENTPNSPRPGYGLHGSSPRLSSERSNAWIWIAAFAVLLLFGIVMFGASGTNTTADVHPGGAGAPPVVVDDGAEAVAPPAADLAAPAPAAD